MDNEPMDVIKEIKGLSKDNEADFSTGSFKVIYMYTIDDGKHDGRIKIGDATLHTSKTIEDLLKDFNKEGFISNSEIESSAIDRINGQTKTADVEFRLLFNALAVRKQKNNSNRWESFRDYQVHETALRSGFKKKFQRSDKNTGEWFELILEEAKNVFTATVERKAFIEASPVELKLRPEQWEAIRFTKSIFNNGSYEIPKEVLWNAIMRFGKTLTTYNLIKEINRRSKRTWKKSGKGREYEIKKTLIITHRPVVQDGWFEDYKKVFGSESCYQFAAKNRIVGINWGETDQRKPFFYFASIQDLRGSFENITDEQSKDSDSQQEILDKEEEVLESLDNEATEADVADVLSKNEEIFNTEWDLVIIDEAHEGTKTNLANRVKGLIKTRYRLYLSGTPFNIIEDFDNNNVFTFDYIDEQKAKIEWQQRHDELVEICSNKHADKKFFKELEEMGDISPYADLPELEIRTIDISKVLENPEVKAFIENEGGITFNFQKFFEVEGDEEKFIKGEFYDSYAPFKNNKAIADLLNKIFKNDEYENPEDRQLFPFSRNKSKIDFAHTFWILPSIAACKALHEMLQAQYPEFKVVNATGNNDGGDALASVRKAIKENDRTITLSIQKLTTGTTIPEWTGVFMLSNMSSPMLYMQTIFRVKSAGSLIDGRMKTKGYVFDFDPNRCLKMVIETARATSAVKRKNRNKDLDKIVDKSLEQLDEEAIEEFLKYLPIISYDGARFEERDAKSLLYQLNQVYISNTVKSGFTDSHLFDFKVADLSDEDFKILEELRVNVVASGAGDPGLKSLVITKTKGVSSEQRRILDEDEPSKSDNSPEAEDTRQKREEAKAAEKEEKKQRSTIVKTLRGIAARIPFFVLATEFHKLITMDNLTDLIDDESWAEFMPKGVTKQHWLTLRKYFNQNIFDGACKSLLERVNEFSKLSIYERVFELAELYKTFKNPDKETILTPFRVVNLQVSSTFGGLRWVDEDDRWFCIVDGVETVKSGEEIHELREINGRNFVKIFPRWVDPIVNDSPIDQADETLKTLVDNIRNSDEFSSLVQSLAGSFESLEQTHTDYLDRLGDRIRLTYGKSDFLASSSIESLKGSVGVKSDLSLSDSEQNKYNLTTNVDKNFSNNFEALENLWKADTSFLDINSKTALYPLFMTASMWFLFMKAVELSLNEVSDTKDDSSYHLGGLDCDLSKAIWKHVVKNNIFVNCRVPYSVKVAQRVLAGFDDYKINSSVVDVYQVRKLLKDAEDKFNKHIRELNRGKSKDERIDKIEVDEIEKIWNWLFDPDDYNNTDTRLAELVTVGADGEPVITVENFEKILNKVQEKDVRLFTGVVSNPPYQKSKEGNNQALPIYNNFVDTSKIISEYVSMIFKDSWAKAMFDSKNKLHEWRNSIFSDCRVRKVNFCGQIFSPSANVSVSIMFITKENNDQLTVENKFVNYPDKSSPLLTFNENKILFNALKKYTPIAYRVYNHKVFNISQEEMRDMKVNSKSGNIKVYELDSTWNFDFHSENKEISAIMRNDFKFAWPNLRPWNQNTKKIFWKLKSNEIPGERFDFIIFNNENEIHNYEKYVKTNFWLFACRS